MGTGLLTLLLFSLVTNAWAQLPLPIINNPWFHEDHALEEVNSNTIQSVEAPRDALTLVIPQDAHIVNESHVLGLSSLQNNQYQMLRSGLQQNGSLTIENALGARIKISEKIFYTSRLEIKEKILSDTSSDPKPDSLDALPMVCPRILKNKNNWIYQASLDVLIPKMSTPEPSLMLKNVAVDFDYEDSSMIVAVSPDYSKVEKETNAGFYANLHYFIIPYDAKWQNLLSEVDPLLKKKRELEISLFNPTTKASSVREILNQLNGTGQTLGPLQILMHAINLNNNYLPVALQLDRSLGFVHGFIPGPYLSANRLSYALCEWGDSRLHQEYGQKLSYQNFPLWKWGKENKVIMIVLEGDDQLNNGKLKQLEQNQMLRSFDYTDDLVGWFILERQAFTQEKTLVNSAGDFKITFKNEAASATAGQLNP